MEQEQLENIQSQVDALILQEQSTKNLNSEQKNNYFMKQVNDLTNQINKIQEDQQMNRKTRSQLIYLKGKVFQIINQKNYLKQAEDCISKFLKLLPNDVNGWNLLAEIKCKNQDHKGAQQCLQGALQQCGPNKQILRNLSMVLRLHNCSNEDRLKNVQQSVDIAKQAVELDMEDGESWYILGNAYCSNFFVSQKKLDQLQLSLKAYRHAEKKQQKENVDLLFNRAQVYSYLEDYPQCLHDLHTAHTLDCHLQCNTLIHSIEHKLIQLQQSIDNKGKLTLKTMHQLMTDIPCLLKRIPGGHNAHQHYTVQPLQALKQGTNYAQILSCKVTSLVSNKSDIPASFVFMDFQGDFGVISLYNSSQYLYDKISKYSNVQIIDPLYKRIKMEINGKQIDLPIIQVFEINTFYVEGSNVIKEFNPNTVFNENFIN